MSDTEIEIREVPTDDPTALLDIDPRTGAGAGAAMPCYLQLDMATGVLSTIVLSVPDVDTILTAELTGAIRRWPIPVLTPRAANELLHDVEADAQAMIDDATWGTTRAGDPTAHLGVHGEAAERRIIAECNPNGERWLTEDLVVVADADDWYGEEGRRAVVARLGLTAQDSDERLLALSWQEQELAADAGEAGHTVLVGALEWMHDAREQLRQDTCAQLEATAATIAAATHRRDELIRRMAGWGYSTRAIGSWAGLSHTRVQTITRS